MRKVYCIIYDYQGYEERLDAIYTREKDAIKKLIEETHEYEYDNVVDYMREGELSLVEWECNFNNRRVIEPSNDWHGLA